ETLGFGQEEYDIEIPEKGYAEQNPEKWWKKTVIAIKKSLHSSALDKNELKGVSLSGQMHGMVLLNKYMQVIRPAIIWSDQRSNNEVKEILLKLGEEKFNHITLNNLFP